ncbi:MAG TPA: uroporphyrinogen-III synthase [Candidatus Limnocylindria bacterium]|nr:uroporphyrinogen-III synthase [Candidatus Limnocylindria bacterium]
MTPRILVTRPADQSAELVELLEQRGLETAAVPTVAIDGESATSAIDAALADLDGADWLVLTSANGARSITRRLDATGRTLPSTTRVAAVGPATAAVLRGSGIAVDHIPASYLTASIAGGLGPLEGRRVILARADAATPELRSALDELGARVEEVVAYRTIEGPPEGRDALRAALHADLAGIAFTSASAVRGLMRLASPIDRGRARTTPAFCIGPVTAEQARHSGFNIPVIATPHTAVALADAIATHFARGDQ